MLETRLAPAATLLKDINLTPATDGANPSNLIDINGTVFFTASTPTTGPELWKSNGTAAGTVLVKDIDPGSRGSYPRYLTNVNGTLFFVANDGQGAALWKSDGTAAGTVLVKDIDPGAKKSYPLDLTNVNGTLFFSANDGVHGYELWKSDGTAAGTVLVKDINTGFNGSYPIGSYPHDLTNVNGTVFFSANDGVHGYQLWESNGTAAGTVLVKDINTGGSSNPGNLTAVNGTLFFSANDGVHGTELWESNGTAAGTVLVKDINPGAGSSYPHDLTNVNGTLFFSASDADGTELWESNGTATGTVLVKDINPGSSGSDPSNLTNVNGTLFFSANDGVHGTELWESNGTAAGTVLVKDITTGVGSSNPGNLTNVNGTLFFSANDGVHGYQLWESNGTAAGTELVKDINSGGSANPSDLTAVNGTLFFSANGGAYGNELWQSNGTAAGTGLVKNIVYGNSGSYPHDPTNVNGMLFFSANDGVHGYQLWKSNGTTAGTVLVKVINPDGSANPSDLTAVNGTLFFTANDGVDGTELWESNGTAAGTFLVKDINPGSGSSYPSNLTAVNGTLFFSANDGVHGYQLWESNGTAAGTFLVKDINTGGSAKPSDLTNVNGTLFFSANDGVHGYELWESNGTAAGTFLVKDINSGSSGSYPHNLTAVNGTLFFSANDGVHGYELWESNGTAAGTFLVKDINSGASGSNPIYLTNVNGTLFFSANDGVHGYQLWESNGTAAGTVLVKDINSGSKGSYPSNLTAVNGTLFFNANDGVDGYELWESNGTAAGTFLVKDINPGSTSSYPAYLTNINGTLYFSANDGVHGYQLWQSDGTTAGTVQAAEINPGNGDGKPENLLAIGGNLFFTAVDDAHGRELWLDNTAAPVVGTEPMSVTVDAGQTATFTATATGTPTPTVQWQISTDGGATFTNINGATSDSYTTPTTAAADNGDEFQAIFTNASGTATSNVATLTVQYLSITTQPNSQTVNAGQTATFTAAASANPTATVQWQISTNGGATFNNISGATSDSYTTPATSAADNGDEFKAVFTNAVGTVTTNVATLTVQYLSITTQPNSQTVNVGQTATFTAAVSANPTPTVQWQISTNGGTTFSNIGGAISDSYTTPATSAADNGDEFQAVFINAVGSVTTNVATLTVQYLNITTQPNSQTVDAGQTATFTAAASSNPTATVQWQISTNGGTTFSNISGATSDSYTTPATSAADNGDEFKAVFTNPVGSVTTNVATLTVQYLIITTQPNSQTVNVGQTATFTAAASANPTATVQWQISTNGGTTFSNIGGAISDSYTTPATTAADNGDEFKAVFINAAGSVTTNVATLTVQYLSITTQPNSQTVDAGQTATFTAAASSNPTATVQWQISTNGGATFSNISGATSDSYTTPATAAGDNGDEFQAVFTNPVGSVTTNVATLTVQYLSITTQPDNQAVNPGVTATFTAAASSNPTATVQWQISTNGGATFSNISGATSDTYVTPVTTITDNGEEFQAVFTNATGSVTTNVATLTVAYVIITMQPESQTVDAGQTATFTAAAMARPPLTVQWQISTDGGTTFSNISGATSDSYTTPATTAADNGDEFQAVFTNPAGSATTNVATLTVQYLSITTQPNNQTVDAGQTATFTAAASSNPTATVQWQISTDGGTTFNNISGATSDSYTTPATTAADNADEFQAVFTNAVGSVTTNAAILTVYSAPSFTSSASTTFTLGSNGNFTVTASGNPIPTLSEAAGDTLPAGVMFNANTGLLSGTPGPGTGGSYTLHFTAHNGIGSDATQTFTLTVNPLPFSDSFNTATNQQLSANWINQDGNYRVNTTSGTATGIGNLDLATLVGVNASNVAVQATINVSAGQSAGLVADYAGSGDENYYLGGVAATATGYEAYLYRNVNGVFTPLFTQNDTGSADGVLRLEDYESSLKLYLGSTLIAYGDDTTFTGGSVGMRVTAGVALSNFSASALTVGTPSLPFTGDFTTVTSPEPSQLTDNWINQDGNYRVNTTSGTATGIGNLDLATLVGLSVANVTVQANVTVTGVGEDAGLVSRYTGSGDQNYFLGEIVNTGSGVEAYLYQNVNGVMTPLQTQMVTASSGTLVMVTEGTSLTLTYNGVLLFAVANSSLSAGGSVGIRTTAGATVSSFSASVPSTGLPFSDTFSGSQLSSSNWLTQDGSFTVASNTAKGASNLDLATLLGVTATNVAVQATIAVSAGQSAGLVADYSGTGDQNYYLGGVLATATGYEAYLYRNVNGVFTAVFTQTYTGSANGVLRLEDYGSSLKLFLGSTLLAYGDDTSFSGGSVGMRVTAGAAVSNFSASVLTAGTPSLPFTSDFTTATSPEPNQLTNNWINQAGNYRVSNATNGTATGNGIVDLATLVGIDAKNVAVQTTISVSAGQSAGLVADYSGSGDQNYYLGEIVATAATGYNADIFRNVNGVLTSLSIQNSPGLANGVLCLEVYGSSLELLLNGTLIANANDSSLTGGSLGMRVTAGVALSSFSASTLPVAEPSLPFTSDFTTATSPEPNQLTNNWINQDGNYRVNTTSGTATGNGTVDLATLVAVNANNVTVQATINVSAGQSAGLVADYSGNGDQNYYLGGVTATATGYEAYLYRNVNGVFTPLFTQNYTGSADGVLRLEDYGSSLKLFLGSSLIAYGDDTTFSGGSVGMRVTAGVALSNFSANALTVGTPSLPFTSDFTTVTSPEPNQLTDNWINQDGNYRVNTTSGTATGIGTLDLATLVGLSVANVTVQANVTVTAVGENAALVSRYTGSGDQNYYLGGLANTGSGVEAYLYQNVNGVFTLLQSQMVAASSGTLVMVTEGTSLTLAYNGVLLFAVANSSLSAGGSVGMRTTAGATVSSFSASVPSTGLPFSDTFSGSQLSSSNWLSQDGSFTVVSNMATGASTLDLATLVGVTATNVAVQATIAVAAGQAAGLVTDYSGTGDQNYYLGGVTASATGYEAYLYRNVNGVFTALFTQTYSGSANGVLRLEVYGSSLKLFLGSTLIAYGDDTTFSGGSVGMRITAGAAVSNFSASVLSPGTPGLPFTDDFTTVTSPEPNQLTSNWINQDGNYRVNTTSGKATGIGSLDLATLVGINARNVAVQATIAVAAGQSAGLVADYAGSGDENYYLGGVTATATGYEAYLYRNVNGVFTPLFTQNYTGSANGTLQLQVCDSSLQLFLNGNLIAYGNDSTLTGGSVGMRVTAGAVVSNFSASI